VILKNKSATIPVKDQTNNNHSFRCKINLAKIYNDICLNYDNMRTLQPPKSKMVRNVMRTIIGKYMKEDLDWLHHLSHLIRFICCNDNGVSLKEVIQGMSNNHQLARRYSTGTDGQISIDENEDKVRCLTRFYLVVGFLQSRIV